MTNRERIHAILSYEQYDRMPIVDFGFNPEALETWREQGHLTDEDLINCGDGGSGQKSIEKKIGFDFNWQGCLRPIPDTRLLPHFERKVIAEFPDGIKHIISANGTIEGIKEGIHCIPQDIGTLLNCRKDWEELFLPRLQYSAERISGLVKSNMPREREKLQDPRGLHCGSLYGFIRNMTGVQELAYLQADDEDLFYEIINTVGDLCFSVTKAALETGFEFDYAHFWEDICFKTGPLVNPQLFADKVGPHYKKITDLLHQYEIKFVSLDCDGFIEYLIPAWLENGVNVMFPLEVGTWGANLGDLRKKFGRELLAVGGMDKKVFTLPGGFGAIDREVEKMRRFADLGGYIPCPDHRIPSNAIWENVRYYCDKMRETFK
ncbi:MAG: hypothetical protein FWD78_06075 [Treponema sp.]|nr:hypothetical protein [Treponema sp.]